MNYCRYCGAELETEANNCEKCGKELSINTNEEEKKQENNRKNINIPKLAAGVIVLLLIGAAVFFFLFDEERIARAYERALNDEDYEQAVDIYNENEELSEILEESTDKFLEEKYDNYKEGEYSYEETLKIVDALGEASGLKSILDDFENEVNDLKDSKEAFAAGKKSFGKDDFLNAYDSLNNVIQDDPNYDEAQNLLKKTEEEIDNILSKSKDEIEELASQGEIDKAESKYNEIKEIDNEKVAEIDEMIQEAKKEQLLTKFNVYEDEVKGDKKYVPESFGEEVHFGGVGERKIRPQISERNGNYYFECIMGISVDRGIHFDRLVFNVDDEVEEFEIPSRFSDAPAFEKVTEIALGGVMEAVIFQHSPAFDIDLDLGVSMDDTEKASQIYELLKDAIDSETTKLRFQGRSGKGNVDYTLTNADKENLENTIELFKLLK